MITGVKIKKLKVFNDTHVAGKEVVKTPGILMEVLRGSEGLMEKFGQTTFTVTHKETIKAFHWHKNQDDLWFMPTGKAIIVLYDLREDSQTYKQTQVIEAGKNNYKLVVIPQGVAHGYKVLSDEPVLLFYHTTEEYNQKNPDEERLPYNDLKINFDWDKYE